MIASSAEWVIPAVLRVRMPETGEQVDCFGYDMADVEGHLGTDDITLILDRRLSMSTGRVVEQQPVRRPQGDHRTSPGFTTSAATPHGMSGGPVFDAANEVIGFSSGATEPNENHPQWNSFVSGVAAALELNFVEEPLNDQLSGADADVEGSIEDRTIQFAQLVAQERIACELHPTFYVDPVTREAGYVLPSQITTDKSP